jgi:hypothetical protein
VQFIRSLGKGHVARGGIECAECCEGRETFYHNSV